MKTYSLFCVVVLFGLYGCGSTTIDHAEKGGPLEVCQEVELEDIYPDAHNVVILDDETLPDPVDSCLPDSTSCDWPKDLVVLRDAMVDAGANLEEHRGFRMDVTEPEAEGFGYYNPDERECPIMDEQPYLIYYDSEKDPRAWGFWFQQTETDTVLTEWFVRNGEVTSTTAHRVEDHVFGEAFPLLQDGEQCPTLLTGSGACFWCKSIYKFAAGTASIGSTFFCAVLTDGFGAAACALVVGLAETASESFSSPEAFCEWDQIGYCPKSSTGGTGGDGGCSVDPRQPSRSAAWLLTALGLWVAVRRRRARPSHDLHTSKTGS